MMNERELIIRDYEMVVMFRPTLTAEEVSALWERFKAFITERGGEITHEEDWGTRRLAYPIRRAGQKFMEGIYRLARNRADAQVVPQLEAQLRLSEEVLRFLVIRMEKVGTPVAVGASSSASSASGTEASEGKGGE